MKKKNAFTLAEVLITLGIIGIVAAMTLPILTTEYQKKVTATKVKKAYVELNKVIEMAAAEHGNPSGWQYYEEGNLEQWVRTYIAPYVNNGKVVVCPTTGNSVCDGVVAMYGLSYNVASNSANARGGGILLKKGGDTPVWRFYRYSSVYEPVTRIYVYINLPKNKSRSFAYVGKDVFMFILDRRESSPVVRPYENGDVNVYYGKRNVKYNVDRDNLLGKKGNGTWGGCYKNAPGGGYWQTGDSCSAVIMKDGWKIADDYPWRKN